MSKQDAQKDVSSAECTGMYRCFFPELSGDAESQLLVSEAGKERAAAVIEKYQYPLMNRKISLRAGYFLQEAVRLLNTGHYDACISFASGFSLLLYYIAKQHKGSARFIDTDLTHMIQEREQRLQKISVLDSAILFKVECRSCDVEQLYQDNRSLKSYFPEFKNPLFIGEGLTYFMSMNCVEWLIAQMGTYEHSAIILDYWPDTMLQESELFARVFQDLNKSGMILEPLKSFWTTETMALFKKQFSKTVDRSLPEVEAILSAKLAVPPKPAMVDPNQYFPLRMIVGEKF